MRSHRVIRPNVYRSPLDVHALREQLRGGPIERQEIRNLVVGLSNAMLIMAVGAGIVGGVLWYLVVRG